MERIDVYQTQGRGKNRTQRIVIHYNFIGVLDLPEVEEYPENVVLDSRQGVAIEYLIGKASKTAPYRKHGRFPCHTGAAIPQCPF